MSHSRRTILTRSLAVPLIAAGVTSLPARFAYAAGTSTLTLSNGDFEADGTGTATPTGWSTYNAAGQTNASYTEAGGHSGSYRLTHWSPSAYKVETYQHLSGLANGHYTLTPGSVPAAARTPPTSR